MFISLLLDLEPQRLYELVEDSNFNKNLIISRTGSKLRKSSKLADDLYIERNLSTETILGYSRQFLRRFNIDESEINIFLKEKEA